jgi:hypothetical protein
MKRLEKPHLGRADALPARHSRDTGIGAAGPPRARHGDLASDRDRQGAK